MVPVLRAQHRQEPCHTQTEFQHTCGQTQSPFPVIWQLSMHAGLLPHQNMPVHGGLCHSLWPVKIQFIFLRPSWSTEHLTTNTFMMNKCITILSGDWLHKSWVTNHTSETCSVCQHEGPLAIMKETKQSPKCWFFTELWFSQISCFQHVWSGQKEVYKVYSLKKKTSIKTFHVRLWIF
jgi:hypothetical protein